MQDARPTSQDGEKKYRTSDGEPDTLCKTDTLCEPTTLHDAEVFGALQDNNQCRKPYSPLFRQGEWKQRDIRYIFVPEVEKKLKIHSRLRTTKDEEIFFNDKSGVGNAIGKADIYNFCRTLFIEDHSVDLEDDWQRQKLEDSKDDYLELWQQLGRFDIIYYHRNIMMCRIDIMKCRLMRAEYTEDFPSPKKLHSFMLPTNDDIIMLGAICTFLRQQIEKLKTVSF